MQSNQQILEKAIQKAIDGRWKPATLPVAAEDLGLLTDKDIETLAHQLAELLLKPVYLSSLEYGVIFNHDFARALWGEEWPLKEDHQIPFPYWQHKLQAMVIAEDPIKYLGEHI